jgi:hypothetical protein
MSLSDQLNSCAFVGLAVWKTPVGYAASLEFENGAWSPEIEKTTAAEAVLACLPRAIPLPPPPY